MTKIFVVSSGNEDPHETESKKVSDEKKEDGEVVELHCKTKEQSLSVYELLLNEYELRNPTHLQSSSRLELKEKKNEKTAQNSINEDDRSKLARKCAVSASQCQKSNTNNDQNMAEISLDSERCQNEGRFRRRTEMVRSIILNRPLKMSWIKGLLNTLIIIIIGFLFTVPLSIFPAHDLIKYPSYWYEHIFHGILSTTLGWILQCFRASYFLNITKIRKCRNVIFMCLIGDAAMISFLILSYHLWTTICGYVYPVPFLGIIATYSFRVLYCVAQWVSLPKAWRYDKKFRHQVKFFMFYILSTILIDVCYNIAVTIVRNSSNQNQPYVSLTLPLAREICLWVSTQLVKYCANGDVGASKIILNYIVTTVHTISLCYTVTIVTNTTSWVLMIVDFAINTTICLRIVWLNKKAPLNLQDQINRLQELALYELVEFQAPLTFVLVIIVAYFGPNAELFGNISNSYWSYKSIEDLQETLENMMLLFLIDFSSTILSSIILWFSCSINLWKVFVVLQKEFKNAFCVSLGYIALIVSINLCFSN